MRKILWYSSLLSFLIAGMILARVSAETAPAGSGDGAGCLWGKLGEKTTYLQPYCPAMAPEIPYGPTAEDRETMKRRLPMRPEDALTVVMSDGCTYKIYYKESVRYRPVANYTWVFEPMEKVEMVPVDEVNPYTGQVETRWVEESMKTNFPVFHEKETIDYEPEKVLVRVIIPGTPSPQSGYGNTDNGSAELHFETDVEAQSR